MRLTASQLPRELLGVIAADGSFTCVSCLLESDKASELLEEAQADQGTIILRSDEWFDGAQCQTCDELFAHDASGAYIGVPVTGRVA